MPPNFLCSWLADWSRVVRKVLAPILTQKGPHQMDRNIANITTLDRDTPLYPHEQVYCLRETKEMP